MSQYPEVSFHRIDAFDDVGRYTLIDDVDAASEDELVFKVKLFELYTVVPLIWKLPPTTSAPVV